MSSKFKVQSSKLANARWTVGVDFGGTYVKLGLVDGRGRVRLSETFISRHVVSPGVFIERLSEAVARLTARAGIRPPQLRGVGVGVPGPIDAQRGLVHTLVNLPGWRQVPLRALLQRTLHCPCAVDNDANLYTLGEARFGAGRGARSLIGITLGTGVGGGLIFDGRVYRGVGGAAGEIGHMVVNPDGPRCGCGSRGCLEAQVGTRAILTLAQDAMRRRAGALRRLARRAGAQWTPALVSEAAARGDEAARSVWRQIGGWLGVGVANLINVLNPDRVVIGGGVSNAWRWFAPSLRQRVRAQALEMPGRCVRIVRAQRGNEAGIVGAAVLVWNEINTSARPPVSRSTRLRS